MAEASAQQPEGQPSLEDNKEYDPAGDGSGTDVNSAGDGSGTDVNSASAETDANSGKREREVGADEDVSKRIKTEVSPAMEEYLKELLEEQIKLVPFASALPNCAKLLQREIEMIKSGKGAPTEPIAPPAPIPQPAPYQPVPTVVQPTPYTQRAPVPAPADESISSGMREVLNQAVASGGTGDPLTTSVLSHQDEVNGTCKTSLKVMVPTHKHPGFNFIGRLLGPRGNTLKELQRDTGCKMLIRGKGSVKFRNGETEWEMAKLPQHAHLTEPLHVIVDYEGPSRGREAALTKAEMMLRELCTPSMSEEGDEIKRQQLRELAQLNGTFKTGAPDRSSGRGAGYPQYGGYGRQQQPQQQYGSYGAAQYSAAQYQAAPAAQGADQASLAAYQQGFVAAQQALQQQQQMAYQDPYQQYYGQY